MKRNLIIFLSSGIMLLILFSFSSTKVKHKNISRATAHTTQKQSNCTADITSFTVNSISSSSINVTWTYSGNPSSFNYGGYYNYTTGGSMSYPTTNTTSTTITKDIPYNAYGVRIGVACVCSDGSVVGSGHGAYCENGHVVNYF